MFVRSYDVVGSLEGQLTTPAGRRVAGRVRNREVMAIERKKKMMMIGVASY